MDAASLLAPLVAAPDRTALVFDVDGTLAPIVARPELASVPEEVRVELGRLAARYGLVACLSGRTSPEAARLVGVDGIRVVGNHGLELHADAAALEARIARFREQVDGRWPVEDKGLSLSYHYREQPDEEAALAVLGPIAAEANAEGLDPRWGRKVLEIRPRVQADKGTAVRTIVADAAAGLGLYAGDDTTDIDAFRGLREARLEIAVAIAVDSPEAPEALLAAADLVVDGPAGILEVLRIL